MRQMWMSWSTPSTGRYLFLSQAHYCSCHGIQVEFWNLGRNPHGSKVNGHVPERRALGSPGDLMTATLALWLEVILGTGLRQEAQKRLCYLLSAHVLFFHLQEHCSCSQAKSETRLKDGCLFPYYSYTSFLPIRLHAIRVFPELVV